MAPWLAPGLWFLAGKRGQKGREGAKNLDVMGFEPMTSGLEPAPLTTRSTGSLFENGRGYASFYPILSTQRIFMGGDATENDDFHRVK